MEIDKKNHMLKEILEGLKAHPKTLSPKYFYDKRGAQLFDQICTVAEYYVTRTEIHILKTYIKEITSSLGKRPVLYEFGSGSSEKIQVLLHHLSDIAAYVPIDICQDYLEASIKTLRDKFPKLMIVPLCKDFSQPLNLSLDSSSINNVSRVAFFPGSTIGNFALPEALVFLKNVAQSLGPRGKLLIGVDAIKDIEILERAYNDSQGVTGEFNLNILRRINKELNANFDKSLFKHHAFFNQKLNRIEMHLVCTKACVVKISGYEIAFNADETIHTENSYKYHHDQFISLANEAGFSYVKKWSDEKSYFNIFLLQVS